MTIKEENFEPLLMKIAELKIGEADVSAHDDGFKAAVGCITKDPLKIVIFAAEMMKFANPGDDGEYGL